MNTTDKSLDLRVLCPRGCGALVVQRGRASHYRICPGGAGGDSRAQDALAVGSGARAEPGGRGVTVIGVDPSFQGFGMSDGDRTIAVEAAGETLRQKCGSLYCALMNFVEIHEPPMLWVVEQAMPSERNRMHLYNVGFLMSHVYDAAEAIGDVEIREVAAGTLKVFVVDNGGANKAEMAIGVFKRWGAEFANDSKGNKSDAYALYQFGMSALRGENPGVRPPNPKRVRKTA